MLARLREILLPYALFILGAAVAYPLNGIIAVLVITPIHEMGHVLAAFATGGYGAWDVQLWNRAVTYGGSNFWISIAGVLFVLAVSISIPLALLRFRRWTAFGGMLYLSGLLHAVAGHDQHDFHVLRVNGYAEVDLVLDVMTVIMVVVMFAGFSILLTRDLSRVIGNGAPGAPTITRQTDRDS